MLAIPGMIVMDPLTPEDARQCLGYALQRLKSRNDDLSSFYFRLRRTPAPEVENFAGNRDFEPLQVGASVRLFNVDPRPEEHSATLCNVRFVCMGTIAVNLALSCRRSWNASKRRRKTSSTTAAAAPAFCGGKRRVLVLLLRRKHLYREYVDQPCDEWRQLLHPRFSVQHSRRGAGVVADLCYGDRG